MVKRGREEDCREWGEREGTGEGVCRSILGQDEKDRDGRDW